MKNHDGITQLIGRLSNKIYIVECGDELVVVDPGMPSDHRRLFNRIRSLGRSPRDVTAIVLTHFHVDHAGSAARLKEISNAKLYVHAEDAPYQVPPVEADVSFSHGDVLPLLGGLVAFHAPGHTPGSSVFLWRDRGVLFTGDAIQNLYFMLTLPEPGFCWDLPLAGRSAAKVIEALADEDYRVICAGHGPIVRSSAPEKMARFDASIHRRGKA